MSFSAEDLAQLSLFIEQKVSQVVADVKAAEPVASEAQKALAREAITGRPDISPDAGPDYYIHLANGDVIESKDSASTHMDVNGETVAVIGRYQKGA